MVLKIYNTLSRQKEEFKPLKEKEVSFYWCGPTVYSTQHIGNLRGAFLSDLIRRSLGYLGYEVNFVSNYTDVGHLTSDEDEGEDKMEKGAKEQGKSPEEIANKFIKEYEEDIKSLNIQSPTTKCRATDYIPEMIEMIQTLLDKNFAYITDLAIYFDVSKAKDYTKLSGQKTEDQIQGAGTGDVDDNQKKHPADFALWFFKAGTHKNALQFWQSSFESPLVKNGEGFPGWHIECSAMAKKHLGKTLDIHMGGVEHIPVHHNNEIAQSESANDTKFVNYWLHNEHLNIGNTKISKSLGNVVFISDIEKKGFNPLALRYLFLQAHYRSKQNFTWDSLESAQNGLNNLYKQIRNLRDAKGEISQEYKEKFIEKLLDDFNLPQALATVQELLKSNISNEDKLATILDFDKILGLDLDKVEIKNNLEMKGYEILELKKKMDEARSLKKYDESDKYRKELEDKYNIKVIQKDDGESELVN